MEVPASKPNGSRQKRRKKTTFVTQEDMELERTLQLAHPSRRKGNVDTGTVRRGRVPLFFWRTIYGVTEPERKCCLLIKR